MQMEALGQLRIVRRGPIGVYDDDPPVKFS